MFYDFITKYTDFFFFVEKNEKSFALQKFLTFFQQKILAYLSYLSLNFNKTLTNDVVSFEQSGPGVCPYALV